VGDPLPASGLQLQADLQAAKLRYLPANTPPEQALELPELRLALKGSPEQASLTLTGQAKRGTQTAQIDTALQAGLATARGAAPLDWQASIDRLQARLNPGQDLPGPWQVQLAGKQPVQIAQRAGRHQRGAKAQHEGIRHPVERQRPAAQRLAQRRQGHGRPGKAQRHRQRRKADRQQHPDRGCMRSRCTVERIRCARRSQAGGHGWQGFRNFPAAHGQACMNDKSAAMP